MQSDNISDKDTDFDEKSTILPQSYELPDHLRDRVNEHAINLNNAITDSNGKIITAAGRGVGMRFVATYFPEAETNLRIATGYFSLSGYDLGRDFISANTKIQVLVGQAQKDARVAVASEMASELIEIMRELGTTPVALVDAVAELISRIKAEKFIFRSAHEMKQEESGGSRERRRFHCKFYIADDAVIWMGSANFSRNGLSLFGNEEQLVASRDPEQIEYYCKFYDEQLALAHDLLADLQKMLEQWLNMHDPFDAYLKALLCSYSSERYPIDKPAHEPTYFQEGVIARAVDQVKRYDGALLLVATGLGKTVIGAEIARRLLADYSGTSIHKLVVIAPRITEANWCNELKGRGYPPSRFFDNSILFRAPQEDETRQVYELETFIQDCNDNTIFLIDEAHRYRNLIINSAHPNRRSRKLAHILEHNSVLKDRVDKIAKRGGKIILLTATPYGTQKQNINSLLRMLPPTSPSTKKIATNLFDQEATSGFAHWNTTQVNKTSKQKVVTILGMLHVLQMARDRGNIESDGRLYIEMPDGIKYFPRQIRFYRLTYPMFLQDHLERAYDAKIFDAQLMPYKRWSEEKNDAESGVANSWLNNTLRAWLSSPRELRRVLQVCHDLLDPTPDNKDGSTLVLDPTWIEQELAPTEEVLSPKRYRVKFTTPHVKRRRMIQPILDDLESTDLKLNILIEHVKTHREKDAKIIIFVKRHATAVYIHEKLSNDFDKVGCTVECSSEKGEYKLKTDNVRKKLIRLFAPIANTPIGRRLPSASACLDILICTDADGVGQNMQDATVVINYDLPLTADELFQRAGRVLRPTIDRDRDVYIYTLVPGVNGSHRNAALHIGSIVATLSERQNQANDVMHGGTILPTKDEESPVVMQLAYATDLDKIPGHYQSVEDNLQHEASNALRHSSNFEMYKSQAKLLEFINILSAKIVNNPAIRHPHICVFIKSKQGIDHVLFNLYTDQIVPYSREDLLDLLECPPDFKKDTISAKQVEAAGLKAFSVWFDQQPEEGRLSRDDYERVCVVHLRLESSSETIKDLEGIFVDPDASEKKKSKT
ncbi:MAG: helicase-related protein [Armatimonas sp.]